jgi:membrane-associated phospholipid phosphatase
MVNRSLFQKYMITYIVVFLAGFTTYILYPAVPPWMAGQPLVQVGNQFLFPWVAAQHGYPGGLHNAWAHSTVYLPHTRNLFGDIMKNWYNPYNGTIVFGFLHGQYDQVAAIPSEHAAYPMLFFLFLRRQFGNWGYLALAYIGGLLFSITYLGQHYVIDAVIGFAYAAAGYGLVMHAWPAFRRSLSTRAARTPALPLAPSSAEEA